ncbi:hypothetical protein D3C78_1319320 [compost metagenome]
MGRVSVSSSTTRCGGSPFSCNRPSSASTETSALSRVSGMTLMNRMPGSWHSANWRRIAAMQTWSSTPDRPARAACSNSITGECRMESDGPRTSAS